MRVDTAAAHARRRRRVGDRRPAAPGGSKDYVVNGDMSGGFALIAWPAEYDVTGVMTFLVNEDGIVFQKDLGKTTGLEAARITRYDPDASWSPAD